MWIITGFMDTSVCTLLYEKYTDCHIVIYLVSGIAVDIKEAISMI